jgi:Spy/CpxP family protein refolding chaperone
MSRVQGVFVTLLALALGAALAAAAVAQPPQGPRRGFMMGPDRGSLLGLLRIEQVQKELKLSDEVAAKVRELRQKLGAEMREKFAGLREIEDREQRRAKMTELSDEFDRKAREQLREVLSREQMMRLYQIRMQVRPAVESLANRRVAGRLQLTEEQQQKLAQLSKDVQAKQSELLGGMRDATQEQRREMFEKLRKIRSDADEQALGVLTAEQKEAFEKMKGAKIELPTRRGRQ